MVPLHAEFFDASADKSDQPSGTGTGRQPLLSGDALAQAEKAIDRWLHDMIAREPCLNKRVF